MKTISLAARAGLALALLVALSGCFFNHGGNLPKAAMALEGQQTRPPQPQAFTLCRDYGCLTEQPVGLDPAAWTEVTAPLRTPASDPAAERRQVALAVGRFELAVGAQAGTENDIGGTLTGFGEGGQQDCIDEAVNTTRFLLMIQAAGLLHHHSVGTPVHRAWIADEITHITATLVENTARGRYAIDSWFHGNGHAAEVMEITAWLDGWQPEVWRFEAAAGSYAEAAPAERSPKSN